MASDLYLNLNLLDKLCDKLDDSGIDGNVIERDSHGEPYVNIWYGSYEDRERESSEMFTVVVTDYSLYSSPHGSYEISPPGKYRDYFKDTFESQRKSSGFYVWIMSSEQIVRTIKFLFNREKWEKKKENNVANWENEKRILKDVAESINHNMNTCFVANMCTCAGTQEPVILVQDLYSHYIFEIYYDYNKKMYSVVPRGALGDIADEEGYVRNSIHMGFGFAMIAHSFLKDIYDKWKKSNKKENNMNNDSVIEATRQLCHIIACEAGKSPLRWTDGENIGGSIYIHNRDYDDNKVCRVSVGHASSSDAPVKAYYSVYFIGKYSSIASEVCKTSRIAITSKTTNYYIFTLPRNVIDFVKEVISRSELEKENKMSEFTLATRLFGKLNKANIDFRFKNGIYNPEEIIITAKDSKAYKYDIASVRSIPDSEPSELAYEVRWMGVPSFILANHEINKVQGYQWSDDLVNDILLIEKDFKSIKLRDALAYSEADVLATEVMHKYRNYGITDIIFNDPATIIIWADGSKTVVKAENEKFDPEKGLAMAISKKVLGNKHDYYEVFKRYVGRYEKKQGKKNK